MKISIVVPCHNESEALLSFYSEIIRVMQKLTYNNAFELIFVNDGSSDNTLEVIKSLNEKDPKVGWLDLSRNFGKEAAILAGFEHCSGEVIILMDADLQDPPSLIPQLIEGINEGYDCVYTRRTNRTGEPPIRSFFAEIYYKLVNNFTEVKLKAGTRDYRIMTREFVQNYLKNKEINRFSKGLFEWIGYKTKCIDYENVDRISGETSWSFKNLFKYGIDGIVAFSISPLRFSIIMGMVISIVSFAFLLYILIKTILLGNNTSGWASTTSIMLFLGGIQLISIGILGEYIGKIFYEVKGRPIYLLKNFKPSQLSREQNIQKEVCKYD